MRLVPVLPTLALLASPVPALACGGACPTGLAAFAPLLLVGGGFVLFALGKLVLGRFL